MAKARVKRSKPAKPKARARTRAKPKAKPKAKAKPKKRPVRRPSRPPPPVAPSSATGLVGDLVDALEYAQSISPVALSLQSRSVQNTGRTRTPWLVVGRFVPSGPLYYDDVYRICKAWEASLELESMIHSQRLSRMRVDYTQGRYVKQEYTVSETAPWEMMISRAVNETNPRIAESLTARYGQTVTASTVGSIYVWLSRALATDAVVDLTKM